MKNNFGDKILANLLTMISGDEKFRSEVIAIRDKHRIPESGFDEEYAQKYGKDAVYYCAEDLGKLIVKYKLNQHYGIFLMFIICFGRLPDRQIIDGAKPIEIIKYTERSGLDCAAIIIYPETSQKDIENSWKEIEKFRYNIYGRKATNQKLNKNSLRDFYIFSLKRQGRKNKFIKEVINNVFENNSKISGYEDVSKIISKNKLKAKKLLKHK